MKLRTLIFLIIVAVIILSVTGVISLSSLFGGEDSGETVTMERSFDADEFFKLEIEWAAGSVKIVPTESDEITVQETKKSGNTQEMVTAYTGSKLTIRYAEGVNVNMANLSGKDLLIKVPQNWSCDSLKINGAALDIDVTDLKSGSVELSGAAAKLNYSGSVDQLKCDGAAAEVTLHSTKAPDSVSINGAACKLDLTLPAGTGFAVKTDGVAVDFNSSASCSFSDDTYTYGDGSCEVKVSGLGCSVKVNHDK